MDVEKTELKPVLRVTDLRKSYSAGWFRGASVEALRGVSLDVGSGEVFGLLGPNGAGKTTLIKSILGIIKPSGGSASLFGQKTGAVASRGRVGYLPEALRIDRHHTAVSALAHYGRLSHLNAVQVRERQGKLLELVGLSDRARESVRRFSKGMLQRLGLAQALLHDPDLLILDEPTDGLDPVGRSEVRQVLERLSRSGKTIFLNSHILQEVELVCTRVAVMAKGQLRGVGTIDELCGIENENALKFKSAVRWRFEPTWSPSGDTSDSSKHICERIASAGFAMAQLTPVLDRSTPFFHCDSDGMLVELQLDFDEASEIDRWVDWLRGAGHSLVGLAPDRPSLEQVFLRMVAEAEAEEAAASGDLATDRLDQHRVDLS